MLIKIIAIFSSASIFFAFVKCQSISDDSITFRVLPGGGQPEFNSTFDRTLSSRGCSSNGKFFIIVHGWLESWRTQWVQDLVSNLTVHRGGCIIFMDYSNFSTNPNYFLLTPQFENISTKLLKFMHQLHDEGFDFGKGYMFGFSFGAWLAIKTAKAFEMQKFEQIDVCDPAGPGFDAIIDMGDHSMAAKNVQCIHTNSGGFGTLLKNCSQNWLMGVCGIAQVGAQPYPKGHHGLCPYFYTAAFSHDFVAYQNIYACYSARPATGYPDLFKMGYLETFERKRNVTGDLFSPTSAVFPWNEIPGRTTTTLAATMSPKLATAEDFLSGDEILWTNEDEIERKEDEKEANGLWLEKFDLEVY